MAANTLDFPFGDELTEVQVVIAKEFPESPHSYDLIRLVFQSDRALSIVPIPATDELELSIEKNGASEPNHSLWNPEWAQNLIGRRLMEVWKAFNGRGYCDLTIIGFDRLHPSLHILAEGSVLLVFRAEIA